MTPHPPTELSQTNSPLCNHVTAFTVPQYQMTCFSRASGGMCRNRPALIFCQLSHRSTAPTMPVYRHVSAVSPNCFAMPVYRHVSAVSPNCFAMPPFRQCHHSTVSLNNSDCSIIRVREHACQGTRLSGNTPVREHACQGTRLSGNTPVREHACQELFRERYHSDNDLILGSV